MAARVAKELVRKDVKSRIAALGDQEKARQSKIVSNKLLHMDWWLRAERVAVFLSMNDEICTEDIVRRTLDSGKDCFVPRYVGNTMDMLRLHSWQDFQNLPETSWKIKQPADSDNSRDSATDTGLLYLIDSKMFPT